MKTILIVLALVLSLVFIMTLMNSQPDLAPYAIIGIVVCFIIRPGRRLWYAAMVALATLLFLTGHPKAAALPLLSCVSILVSQAAHRRNLLTAKKS